MYQFFVEPEQIDVAAKSVIIREIKDFLSE